MTSRQATGSNAHSCFGPPHSCDTCVSTQANSSTEHAKQHSQYILAGPAPGMLLQPTGRDNVAMISSLVLRLPKGSRSVFSSSPQANRKASGKSVSQTCDKNCSSQESLIRAACKVPTLSRYASMAFDCSAGISMRHGDHDHSRPGWLSLGKLSLTETSLAKRVIQIASQQCTQHVSASRTP